MGLAKTWRNQDMAYAHLKRDGICLCVKKNKTGLLAALTTTHANIIDQLKTCGWLEPIMRRMPADTKVYGELYVPGKPASYVKTALAHWPRRLSFNAFAHGDMYDKTWSQELYEMNELLMHWGFQTIPFLVNERCENAHLLGGCGYFDDPNELIERELPEDVEGYVLKNSNFSEWYKLKPVKTIDLVVTKLQPGRIGKYYGQVGALHVATRCGIELARVSGMPDDVRADITSDDIGRVCEVRYQYVGAKGRLRHPAFVRWRDDKTVEGCGLDQDPELEEYWNDIDQLH